ncbi:MAG UNVERIFIED_CONTAM: hypothetical protein LVT10_04000 [Anaerolineae bacterium]
MHWCGPSNPGESEPMGLYLLDLINGVRARILELDSLVQRGIFSVPTWSPAWANASPSRSATVTPPIFSCLIVTDLPHKISPVTDRSIGFRNFHRTERASPSSLIGRFARRGFRTNRTPVIAPTPP